MDTRRSQMIPPSESTEENGSTVPPGIRLPPWFQKYLRSPHSCNSGSYQQRNILVSEDSLSNSPVSEGDEVVKLSNVGSCSFCGRVSSGTDSVRSIHQHNISKNIRPQLGRETVYVVDIWSQNMHSTLMSHRLYIAGSIRTLLQSATSTVICAARISGLFYHAA